jgi:hypothetical protein
LGGKNLQGKLLTFFIYKGKELLLIIDLFLEIKKDKN